MRESSLCRSRCSDTLPVETPDAQGGELNRNQHATGRGTRGNSSSALTGVRDEASDGRFACDRNVRLSQFQSRLDEHTCAARASAAAVRSRSCCRVSASSSIVKKLCIAAPVLLHHDPHDSVGRTWQRMNCEVRKGGDSRRDVEDMCRFDHRRSTWKTGHLTASAANASGSAPTP
jgi:hypothetical protein